METGEESDPDGRDVVKHDICAEATHTVRAEPVWDEQERGVYRYCNSCVMDVAAAAILSIGSSETNRN